MFCLADRIVAAPTLQNMTITAPIGSSDHGNPHILCIPQKATAVATFFLANYFAHVATVKSIPGQPLIPSVLDQILTLFFPGYGIIRGLSSIRARAVGRKKPLETALLAGALCEVVRTKYWHPQKGDTIHNVVANGHRNSLNQFIDKMPPVDNQSPRLEHSVNIPGDLQIIANGAHDRLIHTNDERIGSSTRRRRSLSPIKLNVRLPFQLLSYDAPMFEPVKTWKSLNGRQVHGYCRLPAGFALSIVPNDTKFKQPENEATQNGNRRSRTASATENEGSLLPAPYLPGKNEVESSSLGSFYSFAKGAIAILQLLYASYTLVQTRGDQIDRFGYAAFGLTVTPYLMMSLINLLSSLLTPDYSHMYLVESDVMLEAKRHGGSFEGHVGRIDESLSTNCLSVEFVGQDASNYNAFGGESTPPGHSTPNEPLYLRVFSKSRDGPVANKLRGKSPELTFDCLGDHSRRTESPETEKITLKDKTLATQSRILRSLKRGVQHFWRDYFQYPRQAHLLIPFRSRQSARTLEDMIRAFFLLLGSTFVGALPLAVIGGMSGFHQGQSTQAQRAWTMTWLAAGIAIGPISYLLPQLFAAFINNRGGVLVHRLVLFLYAAPAIGGFVVVSEMLWSYAHPAGTVTVTISIPLFVGRIAKSAMCNCFADGDVEIQERARRYPNEPRRTRLSFVRPNDRSPQTESRELDYYRPRTSGSVVVNHHREEPPATIHYEEPPMTYDHEYIPVPPAVPNPPYYDSWQQPYHHHSRSNSSSDYSNLNRRRSNRTSYTHSRHDSQEPILVVGSSPQPRASVPRRVVTIPRHNGRERRYHYDDDRDSFQERRPSIRYRDEDEDSFVEGRRIVVRSGDHDDDHDSWTEERRHTRGSGGGGGRSGSVVRRRYYS
ncbi:MAG: hypothetical protein Q9227_000176 [Pyrenula ochraceoflavens]